MPFNYDVTNPTDTSLIPSYPADARAFRVVVEGAIDIEHDSAEARHKFVSGNEAARDAITTWVDGSIVYRTDIFTGEVTQQRYNGSTWDDVGPPANVPRLDGQSEFSVAQWAEWEEVIPSGVNVAIDLATSPAKYVTAATNVTINNPTGAVSAHTTTINLEITMSGAGNTIAWGTSYRSPNGVAPAYTDGSGDVNIFMLSVMQTGAVLVTSATNVGTF